MNLLNRLLCRSSHDLDALAAKVANLAFARLSEIGFELRLAQPRPAVARGYIRVHAAQAVRESLRGDDSQLNAAQTRRLQELAVGRLTDRIAGRPGLWQPEEPREVVRNAA